MILPGDFDGDGRRDDFVLGTKNLVGCPYFDGVGPQAGPGGTSLRDLAVADQGTLALPVFIPPSLLWVELHHQLGVVDPATPSGLATSNGLRLRYGN